MPLLFYAAKWQSMKLLKQGVVTIKSIDNALKRFAMIVKKIRWLMDINSK